MENNLYFKLQTVQWHLILNLPGFIVKVIELSAILAIFGVTSDFLLMVDQE